MLDAWLNACYFHTKFQLKRIQSLKNSEDKDIEQLRANITLQRQAFVAASAALQSEISVS